MLETEKIRYQSDDVLNSKDKFEFGYVDKDTKKLSMNVATDELNSKKIGENSIGTKKLAYSEVGGSVPSYIENMLKNAAGNDHPQYDFKHLMKNFSFNSFLPENQLSAGFNPFLNFEQSLRPAEKPESKFVESLLTPDSHKGIKRSFPFANQNLEDRKNLVNFTNKKSLTPGNSDENSSIANQAKKNKYGDGNGKMKDSDSEEKQLPNSEWCNIKENK